MVAWKFYSTYEELKPVNSVIKLSCSTGFYSTYEELKHYFKVVVI